MALILDVSELTQSAATKPTAHDNCTVIDLGTGAFPRDIEVRLPDDDGARQNALWDGSLNLAVDDEVLCFEYSGISAWRVMAMGGNDGGVGKARVSEIWDSVFGDVALESDASGNIGIGTTGPDAKLDVLATAGAQLRLTFENEVKFTDFTVDTNHNLTIDPTSTGEIKLNATVTVLDEIQREGDDDTKIGLDDDKISLTAGGLLMFEATEIAGQDTLDLGDVAGGGDVDINFNNGQMFIRGSNGRVGFSDTTLPSTYTFYHETQSAIQLRTSADALSSVFIGQTSNGTKASPTTTGSGRILMRFSGGGYDGSAFTNAQAAIDMYSEELFSASDQGTNIRFLTTPLASTTNTERMRLTAGGFLGINRTSPQGMLHGYDSISGFEHWKFNGLDATNRTIIPNGTGDVLFYLTGIYVMRNSAGVAVSGSVAVANGGTQNITVGADTVTITVAAAGTVTIARSAGSNTIRVGLWLLWL